MEPIIEFKNLSMGYNLGKTNEVWALQDITGAIYPEEFVIFFGPSGCGKSTLLYIVSGLEFPSRGSIVFSGKNLKELNKKELIDFHRSSIGIVFQAYHLVPSLSVKDNIALPQLFSGNNQLNGKVDELMKRFGIYDLKNQKPSLLSGGQQQRVAIARALVQDPPVILADEAVGNLDSKNAAIVLDLLEELNKKDKKTIVYVTHNPRDLDRADVVFYMKDGRILKEVRNEKSRLQKAQGKTQLPGAAALKKENPHLEESKLRAKLITNNVLNEFSLDTQLRIEEIVNKYILQEINDKDIFTFLDRPYEKGGADLNSQKARAFSRRIIELVKENNLLLSAKKAKDEFSLDNKITELRKSLLNSYKSNLNIEQVERFDEFLSRRLAEKINKAEFKKLIDLSFKKGGVGLNKSAAKKVSRDLESIII